MNDMSDERIFEEDSDEEYVLTEWGCLYAVLSDYGVDTSNITGAIGMHLVDDFFELLIKYGYLQRKIG